MPQPSGRNTKAAQNRERRTWTAGAGGVTTIEKDGFGLWIDDITYAFAEISVTSLPILYIVLVTAGTEFFGAKSAATIGWLTMVVVAGTIRGGWVTPLATDVPGWVSITPSLVMLRLIYYNLVLAVVTYTGGMIGTTLALPLVSIAFAILVAGLATGIFPRIADKAYQVFSS